MATHFKIAVIPHFHNVKCQNMATLIVYRYVQQFWHDRIKNAQNTKEMPKMKLKMWKTRLK